MKKDEMLKELVAKKTKLLEQITLLTQQVKDIEEKEIEIKTDKNYFVRQSIRAALLLNKTQLIIGNRKTALNLRELLAVPNISQYSEAEVIATIKEMYQSGEIETNEGGYTLAATK
ncbi:hypothetical protein ENHAE0001_2199 [Enhydrobacter aerosaccus SK60]|nr:hypothetical protein ENHAE0001_2199 [Enhydrobacter aerosaccus SK60]